MNPDSELFKKLVKDAGIQLVHWDDSPRLYIENMTYDGNLAKFAQLIVQECLKKVEEEYKPVLEDKEMMKDTHWDGYVQCGVDSYVAIREHFFGVEE
jgi:hypothetical protein